MICLGLIGLGQAAQILHIPNIEKMENKFEITAVADISKNLTNYIADKYRVPHRFTDGMDLIGCPDVDAVMVMSPGDHAEFAIAALEAGKHVFIEKPMTSSLESLEKLLEVKRRHPDQIAMVGYCRRYNNSFMKMKELLQADSRPISYVRARTIILEGPWYLDNTWHEHKADDLDPAGRELMNRRMFEEIDRVLGGNTSHAQQMAYLLMTASGCHILSAIRELIGLPKAIRSAVVSPNGMQFSLVFEYDNFNMVFEEMNDQEIVEFDEAIEIYQGDRKMLLEYDTPYIRYLPSKLTVSELDCGQAKTTVYGPHYHDMFANELLEFYRCVTTHDTPKCDVFDAAEDVKLYIDVAKMMFDFNEQTKQPILTFLSRIADPMSSLTAVPTRLTNF